MKFLIAFIFLVNEVTVVHSQNSELNLMKYWKHRTQLENFILKGDGIDPAVVHGSYLPAEHRRPTEKSGKGNIGEEFEHYTTYWPTLVYTDANPKCGGLNIGADATMYLGWYISVLATEYKLLIDHESDGQSTLQELWSALEAYERLDKMAETISDDPPNFNGYFLRDDVIFNLATRDDNNDGVPNFPGIGCAIGKFEHSIAKLVDGQHYAQYNNFPADPYDVTVLNWDHYDNSPSPDQVLGLLQGMALVKRCVPENAYVNNQSVLRKAQNIAHKIGNYARWRDYKMTNADGNGNNGTIDLNMVSFPIAQAINKITNNNDESLDLDQDGISGDVLNTYHTENWPNPPVFPPQPDFSPDTDGFWQLIWREMVTQWSLHFNDPNPNWPPDGLICPLDIIASPIVGTFLPLEELWANSCWDVEEADHLARLFTAAAISNEWIRTELFNVADEIDMEIFPLLSDVLHEEDEMSTECKIKCKDMINSAPCNEFGSCTSGSNCLSNGNTCEDLSTEAIGGWMSPNRYLHRDWTEGFKGNSVMHNGLDFLLLYNLYHIKYPSELPYHYSYSNTYSGVLPDDDDYPNGIVSDDIFEQMYSCWACEQVPLVLQNNSTIQSSARVSSVSGTVLNIDENSYYSMIPVTYFADVTYRAGEEIQLTDGFSVTEGASFHAYIDPFECINGQLQRLGEEPLAEWEEQEAARQLPIANTASPALFPNPTTGLITYTGTEAVSSYQIMDLQGRTLHSVSLSGSYSPPGKEGPGEVNLAPASTQGPIQIDLSPYRPGTYLLRVQHESGKTGVHRVVRQ